jgi:hypothetical protein
MVVYEVTAVVAPELRESFERYMLDKHIAAVLATGKFAEALFESSGSGIYRTRYVAEDREALDDYLANHTDGLRRDFSEHFSEGVELSRSEWDVLGRLA